MTPEAPWEGALRRLEGIMGRIEALLGKREAPPTDAAIFLSHLAFRWERAGEGGRIVPIPHPHRVDLASLVGIDAAKEELLRNTDQFVSGRGANHVLLWGERGTGKSSCVKGLLPVFGPRGLRIVELARWDLFSFPHWLDGGRLDQPATPTGSDFAKSYHVSDDALITRSWR